MKTNIFVVNDKEDVNECGLRDAGGHRAIGVYDTEDELIKNIDEDYVQPEKLLANRFLTFLGNRRLTISSLAMLSTEEQQRIKKEFLGSN